MFTINAVHTVRSDGIRIFRINKVWGEGVRMFRISCILP